MDRLWKRMRKNKNILPDDYQNDILDKYRAGTLEVGLKIDCDLDNHLVFKRGQFNLFLGHDNVGKTYWIIWYMVVLSVKHGIRWTIYCSENKTWSIKSKVIGFLHSTHVKNLEDADYIKAKSWCANHFEFIDTKNDYTAEELIKVFETQDTDGFLIDPYNSLNKSEGAGHNYEYKVASLFRKFTERFNKTIYINMHPVSEAGRLKHKDGNFKGQQMPPFKSHAEGGTKWPSRCDDFVIVHRYWTPEMKYSTLVAIEKIKETETGGDRTMFEEPLVFDHKEFSFSINGKNPLNDSFQVPDRILNTINPNAGMKNFMFNEESGDVFDDTPEYKEPKF